MDHPYKEFEKSVSWHIVESAIEELVNNGDLEEKTAREYIVGYIIKCLTENQLLLVNK